MSDSNNKKISISLPERDLNRLRGLAARRGTSVAALLREAVQLHRNAVRSSAGPAVRFQVRISDAEHQEWLGAARAAGMTLSEFLAAAASHLEEEEG